jgi:hypothetical protein
MGAGAADATAGVAGDAAAGTAVVVGVVDDVQPVAIIATNTSARRRTMYLEKFIE